MCHYTRIPIPWYPYPYTHGTPYLLPTYIHALIHLFYLFIYLIAFVFVYLIVFVSLTLLFSLVLSPLALALPPWQGLPLGRGSRSYLSCVYQCFILFNYYPVVCMYSMYVCVSMYCILCVYTSSIVHVSNRCMYVHRVVCIVLCACGPVHV